jgi:hypothetical protein
MVYIDGDNNLDGCVCKDIERELCVPGSNADVNVVCIADRSPHFDTSHGNWIGARLFYCTPGMEAIEPTRWPTGATPTWVILRR